MPAPLRSIGALLALLVIGLLPAAARAHAVLLETKPAAGAVVASAPAAVVLRFNEPVRPIVVQLLRAGDDAALALPPVGATDTRLRLPLPQGLADGSYVLSYRVTSADGHPVAGSFVFGVGAGAMASGASQVDPYDAAWGWLGIAARALWYGALLTAAGLGLSLALTGTSADLKPRLEHALAGLALAGIACGPLLLAAEGGALLGGPLGSLLTAEVWRLAADSAVVWTVGAGVAGLALLILGGGRRPPLLAGALLVALSFGLSGHAATAGPRWLTLPALTLHTLCAAFWAGGLWPLLLELRRPGAQLRLRAFSASAVVAVAILVSAGAVLGVLQVRAWSALVTTDYGQRLLAKLALVAALLGLAALNRLVLTPALGCGQGAAAWLRLTIGVELALASGVVVLTASLGAVPPPRALAMQTAAHGGELAGVRVLETHAATQRFHLRLIAAPATVGANRIDLYLTDAAGQPVDAKAAELAASLPERDVEALHFDALPVERGHFRAEVSLPLAGSWQVQADALIDDFTKIGFRTRIEIGR